MVEWQYEGKKLTNPPKKAVGFIYKITIGDLYYYGQKTINMSAKKLVAESVAIKNGKSNYRKYKSKTGKNKGKWMYYKDEYDNESWKNYTSSSDEVNKLISQGKKYTKEVIQFIFHKGQLNWEEMKTVVCSGCMEDENCLNYRIANQYKRNILKWKTK